MVAVQVVGTVAVADVKEGAVCTGGREAVACTPS